MAKLGPGARLVLLSHTLFMAGVNLSGIYVNLFLFQIGESLAVIGWYHLYQYFALGLGFVIAGKWAEHRDRTIVLRIGIALHAIFFLLILNLGPRAVDLVRELGLLLGFGAGFYWLGNHTLTFDLTADENRDYFNGLFTILGSVVGMVAPFAAGAVIVALPEFTGYRVVFFTSTALLVGGMVVSLFLRSRPSDGVFQLGYALRAGGNPRWRAVMLIHWLNGLRGGVFAFLIGILLFMATGSELAVGSLALAAGTITLTMSWAVGRAVTPRTRWRPLSVGLLTTTGAAVILALNLNPLGIILFALIDAAFAPMYGIPFGALNYKVLEEDPRVKNLRIEYLVAREIPLNIGRMLGVLIFIAVAPRFAVSQQFMAAIILLLGLMPTLSWWSLRALVNRETG